MVTKREVLELIAERSEGGRSTSYRSLVRRLPLPFEAACGHLERLWRERLIESTTPRLPRFRFRLEPDERIGDLRFWLTERGAERLDWYVMRDAEGPP
jgi:hypothetical protein